MIIAATGLYHLSEFSSSVLEQVNINDFPSVDSLSYNTSYFPVGGIKPCVVSLGADQFKVPEQVKQMASYFAMFYASINFGSMISTVVTPLIRSKK